MDYFQRPLDLFYLLEADKRTTNASVQAHDSILDYSSERQPVEEVIDLIEDGVVISWVLSQSIAALLSESESIIDPLVFVVASK